MLYVSVLVKYADTDKAEAQCSGQVSKEDFVVTEAVDIKIETKDQVREQFLASYFFTASLCWKEPELEMRVLVTRLETKKQ